MRRVSDPRCLRLRRRRRSAAAKAVACRVERPPHPRRDRPPARGVHLRREGRDASKRYQGRARTASRAGARPRGSRGGFIREGSSSGGLTSLSRSRDVNSYYDLLGVPPHATELEIRSAYGRDVLRLQDTASDKVAQFRAALDAAFATLVDPDKRTAYDAALAVSQKEDAADSSDESNAAFGYALRGGLWFAGGGVLTAATYAFSQGRYLIAWGPLLFGEIGRAHV